MNTILGRKISQSQVFLENGTRIPVTHVLVSDNTVLDTKTVGRNGYSAVQLGFPNKKKMFIREVRLQDSVASIPKVGQKINPQEVLKPGDLVNVIGVSKGKGYAGVVKRHHFKGGPKTHGQSDRERAPGAIGSTTRPGRVYRGKRMAGRMGHERVTVKNLKVVDVNEDYILVKGLVPGGINSFLAIKKVGEDKKFVPPYQEVSKGAASAQGSGPLRSEASEPKEEKKGAENASKKS